MSPRVSSDLIERLTANIPPRDLAIQWDIAYETLDIEGVLSWTPGGGWERFAEAAGRLPRLVPGEVLVGYHLCYGTFPEWPMYEARDMGVLVRMANYGRPSPSTATWSAPSAAAERREAAMISAGRGRPTCMTQPNGAPCWMDLLTSDTARARDFYSEVFGWTAGEAAEQFGGYFMFMHDGVPVAGCMPKIAGMPGSDGPDVWGVYLSVADAKSTVEAALTSGGTLREGPMDVADLGTQAVVYDATGASVGLWQANAFAGFTAHNVPGAPAYFELLTRDYTGAVAFYRDVFGWAGRVMGDTDEFRLTALQADGETVAGIMDASGFLPRSEPPAWSIYVTVADADAALAAIKGHGGTVTQPPMDTPYGRLAGAADPTGARFKIVA